MGRYRDQMGKQRSTPLCGTKKEALNLANAEEAKTRRGEWHDPTAGTRSLRSVEHHSAGLHSQRSRRGRAAISGKCSTH